MTDTPPPPRPDDEAGDVRPQDAPTEPAVAASAAPAPPDPWPVPAPSQPGRVRRLSSQVRGSKVALVVVGVVVAAGLVLGGVALGSGGGHGGRDGRGGPGAAGQRDGNNVGGRGDDGDRRDGNRRDDRNDGGTNRGDRGGPGARNGAGAGNGAATGRQVLGVVTAVSSTSITIRTSGGSPTYSLSPTTPVTRNGAAAGVTDLKAGEAVVVHLGTAGAVERITVG